MWFAAAPTNEQKGEVWYCGSITLVQALLNIDNEDGSPARQKVQETTEIFPTGYLPGNLNQHRRWATRLPNTIRHRPQR